MIRDGLSRDEMEDVMGIKKEDKILTAVRLPIGIRKRLQEIAENSERSLTQQIIFSLREWLALKGSPSK